MRQCRYFQMRFAGCRYLLLVLVSYFFLEQQCHCPAEALSLGSGPHEFQRQSHNNHGIIRLNDIKRVFCLSDLHTDRVENQEWLVNQLAKSDLQEDDLLIVAGDISHEIGKLKKSLQVIREKCQVFFLPGNHEAWMDRHHVHAQSASTPPSTSSLEKLKRVEQACRDLDVYVDALYLQGKHPLWVIPLQSWYDGTLSFSDELSEGFAFWPWVDFIRCQWPKHQFPPMHGPNARIPAGVVEYFHDVVNAPLLAAVLHEEEKLSQQQQQVPANPSSFLTVSHFLPNQQCLPDWIDMEQDKFQLKWLDHGAPEMSAKFAKVAGTNKLDEQIRAFQQDIIATTAALNNNRHALSQRQRHVHIFGHSHRPKDFEYNGIRYIHHPLGKPREREFNMVAPDVDFQYIWDLKGQGEIPGKQVLRYWEEYGGGIEALHEKIEEDRQAKVNRRLGRYG